MDQEKLEHLLKRFGAAQPEERLFDDEIAADLQERLSAIAPVKSRIFRLAKWFAPSLAAAAAIILMVVYFSPKGPNAPEIAIVADARYSRSELFQTTRAPTARPGEQLFVGVKVDRPVFVRLVGIDQAGRAATLPMTTSGTESMRVSAGATQSFGGYAIRSDEPDAKSDGDLAGVLIAACTEQISDQAFRQTIASSPKPAASQPYLAFQSLEGRIEGQFSCVCHWVVAEAELPVH